MEILQFFTPVVRSIQYFFLKYTLSNPGKLQNYRAHTEL